MKRYNGYRSCLLGSVCVLALMTAEPARTQNARSEAVYRQESLAHARAIGVAYRRLETFIRDESTAETVWTGSVPPPAMGWLDSWTIRGVRARYCEDNLLVYLEPETLKGVGADHRAVHAAPHTYGSDGVGGRPPVLHWLEAGVAEGAVGRAEVVLPACLADVSFGGALPEGRAALAGVVPDPYRQIGVRVTRERRLDSCPPGNHGAGRTMIREVSQDRNGRGDNVGAPGNGPWQILIDACRADYSEWEHYSLACSWFAGAPHNRTMEGRDIWRRLKTVTSGGTTLGAPEFVSSSCWTGVTPTMPTAAILENGYPETMSESCLEGQTGTRTLQRTRTERSTQFAWDTQPIVNISYTNWVLDADTCQVAENPDEGEGGADGDGGGGGIGDCDCPPDVGGGGGRMRKIVRAPGTVTATVS